ncbi:MAG: PEP-CTERM sorting domain-containing protein [Gemmatimonadaceae bacterium]|nr:PEP-CTERM sorting domain-containing protein [Gemmatimonadaceae bacterium]
MRLSSLTRVVAAAALVALPSVSQAQITTHSSLASLLGATSNAGTDDFESLSITGSTPTPITRTAGPHTYTAAVVNNFFGAGTSADHWLSSNTATETITFSGFGTNIRGIGANFFGSDLSGNFLANTSIVVTLNTAAGSLTQTLTNTTLGTFLGFTTTSNILTMTVAAVQPTGAFAWPTMDDLVLAEAPTNVVPEPSTYALMGTGLIGLGAAARRRRAATA